MIPPLSRAACAPSQPPRSSTPSRPRLSSIPPITLGKRHRDSNLRDVTPSLEVGEENTASDEALAKRIIRPSPKKKAKMDVDEAGPRASQEPIRGLDRAQTEVEAASDDATATVASTARASDTHETPAESPPPLTPLPAFSVDQPHVDDINPFNFIFNAPTTSTPHHGDRRDGIWDIQDLAFSPGSAIRSSRVGSRSRDLLGSSNAYDREYQHMLPQPFAGPSMGILEEEPFGALEMATVARPDDSPATRTPFTMYGTEMANDDRFGEHGYDGVVRGMTDFWLQQF